MKTIVFNGPSLPLDGNGASICSERVSAESIAAMKDVLGAERFQILLLHPFRSAAEASEDAIGEHVGSLIGALFPNVPASSADGLPRVFVGGGPLPAACGGCTLLDLPFFFPGSRGEAAAKAAELLGFVPVRTSSVFLGSVGRKSAGRPAEVSVQVSASDTGAFDVPCAAPGAPLWVVVEPANGSAVLTPGPAADDGDAPETRPAAFAAPDLAARLRDKALAVTGSAAFADTLHEAYIRRDPDILAAENEETKTC